MKLVSVIIPCYKDASTLGRAVESVLRQTYSNIEIIVINDCSPETEQIEECLVSYPQVRYLRNPINVGLAATRNNGLAIAGGEIIAFLDADDEYHPHKIALQVNALELNTVVTCGLIHVFPDGRLVKASRPERMIACTSDLLYRNTLNGAGLLVSKDLLLQHGGYDTTLRSCEDFDLFLRLLFAGVKVKDIGLPLYFYHYNPAGLSKNIRNISKWELEVVRRHAARKGPAWRRTPQYASVVAIWLLRHLLRSELAKDEEMRQQTIARADLLDAFPFVQTFFRLIARSRLLSKSALLLRWVL